ncbi:MAG: tetratricopeptide repeat protein [Moraxellaceae bacterium]
MKPTPLSTSASHRAPKLATLTALAAACAMMLSAPVNAEETNANAVPSAMDSSKRVIRLAQPKADANTFQLSTDQQNSAQQNLPQATSGTFTTTRPYNPGTTTATGIDLKTGQLSNIPTPQVQLSDVVFLPTVLIPQQRGSNIDQLDVSLLDDFIEDVAPNATHHPTNFPNRSQRHYTRETIKEFSEWIDPYAKSPNASYDVLIRAAKLNGMGRNLDLGSDYTVRGGQYVDRAIKIQPDSGEANFLYGIMLSEGGGFKEGQKYLDRAVSLGFTEAEQSLAQSDLLNDRRSSALERLRRLESQHPDNVVIPQQIKIIEAGKYYIWEIPAPDINVKPTV